MVPDILANAGGMTAHYFEWVQARDPLPRRLPLGPFRGPHAEGASLAGELAHPEGLGLGLGPAGEIVGRRRISGVTKVKQNSGVLALRAGRQGSSAHFSVKN